MQLTMRFDLRAPEFGAPIEELYAAALDMVAWADEHGFSMLSVAEHHGAEDGYCPSPIVFTSAMAARTRHARLRIQLIPIPFHDPLRLAEDLAVLDLVSGGRLEVMLGAGYRPAEFDMFDVDPGARGRLVEEGVAALRAAWTGEPFEFRDRTVRVTPRPAQRPHPPLLMGGSTPAAARRAARLDLPFQPTVPALSDTYAEERARLGLPAAELRKAPRLLVYVADDPDEYWAALGPHVLHETNSYAQWLAEGGTAASFRRAEDANALRRDGPYTVLTPTECLDLARSLGDDDPLVLHPLVGGLDPELAWRSLHALARDVLPHLDD
jgi:alkanesulfonate monooxygenase SsuD/methylene tetrahydromethanopterin reductase-like flavin-dependent oxidoreductase (luciferase family)